MSFKLHVSVFNRSLFINEIYIFTHGHLMRIVALLVNYLLRSIRPIPLRKCILFFLMMRRGNESVGSGFCGKRQQTSIDLSVLNAIGLVLYFVSSTGNITKLYLSSLPLPHFSKNPQSASRVF